MDWDAEVEWEQSIDIFKMSMEQRDLYKSMAILGKVVRD